MHASTLKHFIPNHPQYDYTQTPTHSHPPTHMHIHHDTHTHTNTCMQSHQTQHTLCLPWYDNTKVVPYIWEHCIYRTFLTFQLHFGRHAYIQKCLVVQKWKYLWVIWQKPLQTITYGRRRRRRGWRDLPKLLVLITIVTLPLLMSWVTSWNRQSQLWSVSSVPRFRMTATVWRICSRT